MGVENEVSLFNLLRHQWLHALHPLDPIRFGRHQDEEVVLTLVNLLRRLVVGRQKRGASVSR